LFYVITTHQHDRYFCTLTHHAVPTTGDDTLLYDARYVHTFDFPTHTHSLTFTRLHTHLLQRLCKLTHFLHYFGRHLPLTRLYFYSLTRLHTRRDLPLWVDDDVCWRPLRRHVWTYPLLTLTHSLHAHYDTSTTTGPTRHLLLTHDGTTRRTRGLQRSFYLRLLLGHWLHTLAGRCSLWYKQSLSQLVFLWLGGAASAGSRHALLSAPVHACLPGHCLLANCQPNWARLAACKTSWHHHGQFQHPWPIAFTHAAFSNQTFPKQASAIISGLKQGCSLGILIGSCRFFFSLGVSACSSIINSNTGTPKHVGSSFCTQTPQDWWSSLGWLP